MTKKRRKDATKKECLKLAIRELRKMDITELREFCYYDLDLDVYMIDD